MFAQESKPAPEICPVCGTEVPKEALACPECGSDHETGWNTEAAVQDGLDLPDKDFDYDAYVKREFGGGGAGQPAAPAEPPPIAAKHPPTAAERPSVTGGWPPGAIVAVALIGLLFLWWWIQSK